MNITCLRKIIIVTAVGFCFCSKSKKTRELLDNLVANVTRDIRPGLDNEAPLGVNVNFNLVTLAELNEVKGYFSVVGFLDVAWTDERMTWEPGDYEGIDSVSIGSQLVWKPQIIISNPAEEIQNSNEIFTAIRFTSDGRALWRPGTIAKATCFIRILTYPFDIHTCYLNMISWGALPSEVTLMTYTNSVTTYYFSENAEWDLTGTSITAWTANNELPTITVGFQFSRKPLFLIVNVLVPIVSLSLLNPVVFLLPQESGERVSFSVTVLLSYTVFLNVIGDNIPKTSSPVPLVCYYIVTVLITSSFITMSVILCQYLYHTHGLESVPIWLLTFLCLPTTVTLNKITNLPTENDNKANDRENYDEPIIWRFALRKLDKVLCLVFTISAISIALGFILSMAYMPG